MSAVTPKFFFHQLLGQYGMLKSVAMNLAVRDLLALRAICRDAYTTITPGLLPGLPNNLAASTHRCKGLVDWQARSAQAPIQQNACRDVAIVVPKAGPSQDKPEDASPKKADIRGVSRAKPCVRCGDLVCNACRYYFDHRPEKSDKVLVCQDEAQSQRRTESTGGDVPYHMLPSWPWRMDGVLQDTDVRVMTPFWRVYRNKHIQPLEERMNDLLTPAGLNLCTCPHLERYVVQSALRRRGRSATYLVGDSTVQTAYSKTRNRYRMKGIWS